ncbi:YceH family protein [Pedobacter sp. JY14-1]|uniref:YceH family protein n=1 Tax=Pedobacter sp. JY14-1 TaxID=3034151 RepID=UPI0023E12F0B|nr:YceH family protein [Pedobacter sp. JY14-1]
MEEQKALPSLTAEETRVLGVLMEKARTTPEYYPMTINAITVACNQKTSRKPVVQYDDQTVTLTLDTLKRKGLVSTATGGSSRAIKYKHNFAIVYPVLPAEVAVICLLMLRGAQTPGELNTNSGRLYEFDSLEEVQDVLEKLAAPEFPYVVQLPRRAGQKEARYAHLLSGMPDLSQEDQEDEGYTRPASDVEQRLAVVEEELAKLKEEFGKLLKELMG